jgi:putative component of membrane protein insertase Oxa1/YidC/SpoIIIJ protein YidD
MRWRRVVAAVTWPVDRGLSYLALVPVWAYRRWLSPLKRGRCVACAIGGGPSCSDVAVLALRSNRFTTALPMIIAQFAACQRLRNDRARTNDLVSAASADLARFAMFAVAATTVLAIGCDNGGGNPAPIPGP